MAVWEDIAEAIADSIRAGEPPVGKPIPSTVKLCDLFGASPGTVRRAVALLTASGYLEGEPGRAVVVVAVPPPGRVVPAAPKDPTLGDLAAQVADLRERVERLERGESQQ